MLSINKSIYVEDNFCYRDYVCQLSKLQHICNRFNSSFCARDHKANQATSNLNRKFWHKSFQQIKSTTSLTDLCFNKKIEQEKKSLYKSFSKSIYVDTCFVLFVIIVTECDVLSYEIFFLRLSLTVTKSTLFETYRQCNVI